ncbi:hypothetical protein AVEN_28901-1 [Araneus ventricosus]|uniref:Uncharacterized protein n=1 Tax=Araneus ventricosus TaxID=182803 RepID=A0A4Y2AJ19_ARAVE|nr:hypothetical protein AVEN_28901-1 [Araneus ventricosus]
MLKLSTSYGGVDMRFRCIRSDDKIILKFFADGFFKKCFNHERRLSFILKAKGNKVNFTNVVVEKIKNIKQSDDLRPYSPSMVKSRSAVKREFTRTSEC